VFERLDRALKTTTITISDSMADAELPDELKRFEQRFIEVMDDDFNTAGAIGVLHELASHINRVLSSESPDLADAMVATSLLKRLGNLLGLFHPRAHKPVGGGTDSLSDDLMKLIIELRASARARKDFATSDAIRDGLAKLGITIEDRADGSTWKKS
jgi:cysteinyl-tRNA synthetase